MGLGYLHENKLLHGDLKTKNVVLDNKGYVTLVDFGLFPKHMDERLRHGDQLLNLNIGDTKYLPPEIL